MTKSFGLMVLALSMVAFRSDAAPAPKWAVGVLPSGHEFSLEVAADDASRGRGYMGRESVGRREGMLFIFDASDRHSFWMKNCKVALDIVWLDSEERVVWIESDRKPCPADGDCPSIVPAAPARYVVEFAAGTVAAESLKLGDALVVLSDPPLR
jgi:uncharacterized membrane protein (UPF0127 family)